MRIIDWSSDVCSSDLEAEQQLVVQDMAVVDAVRYPKPILCRVKRRHAHVDQVVVVGIDVVAHAALHEGFGRCQTMYADTKVGIKALTAGQRIAQSGKNLLVIVDVGKVVAQRLIDRKSTRLNSSH